MQIILFIYLVCIDRSVFYRVTEGLTGTAKGSLWGAPRTLVSSVKAAVAKYSWGKTDHFLVYKLGYDVNV